MSENKVTQLLNNMHRAMLLGCIEQTKIELNDCLLRPESTNNLLISFLTVVGPYLMYVDKRDALNQYIFETICMLEPYLKFDDNQHVHFMSCIRTFYAHVYTQGGLEPESISAMPSSFYLKLYNFSGNSKNRRAYVSAYVHNNIKYSTFLSDTDFKYLDDTTKCKVLLSAYKYMDTIILGRDNVSEAHFDKVLNLAIKIKTFDLLNGLPLKLLLAPLDMKLRLRDDIVVNRNKLKCLIFGSVERFDNSYALAESLNLTSDMNYWNNLLNIQDVQEVNLANMDLTTG